MNEIPNTENFSQMVKDLFKQDTLPMMYMHAGVGIVGEVIELMVADRNGDIENILEELGDLAFYTQALLNLHAMPPLDGFAGIEKPDDVYLLPEAGEVMDACKRFAIYGKPLEIPRIHAHTLNVVACFFSKLRLYSLTLAEVQAANMIKLLTGPKARYPLGKYSDEQANARADKAEVAVGNGDAGQPDAGAV